MTYCVGVRLADGLVMMSDTRTNAGVDHVSTFRKMFVWEEPGERVVCLVSAGNLAITQAVVSLLAEEVRLDKPRRRKGKDDGNGTGRRYGVLLKAPGMAAAARLVGDAVREIHHRDGAALREQGIEFNASFLLGGQIKGGPHRLFMIYAAGNYIEATDDTCFLQIGETKYGKPILDRVITPRTSLTEATKCALVSFDSTMRSNISVGLPLDLMIYKTDSLRAELLKRLDENDSHLVYIRRQWSDGIRKLFERLADPPYLRDDRPRASSRVSPADTE